MKRLLLFLVAVPAFAQFNNPLISRTTDPTGACSGTQIWVNKLSGNLFTCKSNVWQGVTAAATAGGSTGQLQYNNSSTLGGFTAGGDVTFSQPNFTVVGINGGAVPASALVVGTNGSKQPTATATTGSGSTVALATSPTFVTPTLGAATATSINGLTISTSTGTLTITNAKTLSVSNTLTFTGTDSSSVAFGTGGTVAYTANNLSVFAATTSAQLRGVISDETGTGAAVFAGSPTFTGTISAAALTLTSTLTTNLTGGGTQCVQVSNTGVASGTGALCGGNPPLNNVTAATGTSTIANGNNPQIWNWAQTSNTQYGIKFGETSAATNGTGTAQGEVAIVTATGSTAVPLTINNSLNGSQTLPALLINPTWNTTGVVDAALLVNVTNTASGTGSLLADLQVGSSSQFSVDKLGNANMAGTVATGIGGSNAGFVGLTQGTANTACTNCVGWQAPTSVSSAFYFTLPGAPAAGIMRATNATPSVVTFTEISGDCSTSGSNVLTCAKINGTSIPTTSASFDSLLILTSSATAQWEQINGGSSCGDSSHAVSYSQTTHLFGCQSITGTASAGGSNTQLQYNNSTALGGISGWTTNGTTTLTAASSSILDVSGATGTAAFKVPSTTTNTASAAAVIDYDTSNSNYHCNNGADCEFGVVPTASVPATGDIIDASVSSSKFLLHDSGVATANVVTAASNYTNGDLVQAAGNNKTTSDSGVVAANVVTATSAASAAKQLCTASGASKTCSYIDEPMVFYVPAANCNNATAGAGWSIGSGGTVTCRAGTNNLGGYIAITDTSSTFATFQVTIPEDWDSGTNPYIRFQLASTDATNSHTIIPSIQVACYKGDGSTTDDVAANAAHSLSTTTLNGNANRFWSGSNVQMNSTDMTGCVAGALMQVTVGRATDTATNAEFYGATVTFPRLVTVQAN